MNSPTMLDALAWGRPRLRSAPAVAPALVGLAAAAILAGLQIIPTFVYTDNETGRAAQSTSKASQPTRPAASRDRQWAFGGYGGIAYTHPTTVHILNPGRTDLKVRDFGWIGQPFKAPIYYGLRIQRWQGGGQFGAMLDFTHAKAIARKDDIASFEGRINGQPVADKQAIKDVFRHLEFSHGHNMLTLNGLARLTPSFSRFRPYLGAGAGISLPHSEVGLHADNARTYEYHFAGFVGQALFGLELRLGRTSVFVEYKFSHAPYDIPLSHEPRGWLLVTDLWRQFTAWWTGERPPGGRLSTTLSTHHGIGGLMINSHRPPPSTGGP